MSEKRNRKPKGMLNGYFRNKNYSNQNEAVEYKALKLEQRTLEITKLKQQRRRPQK